jgi:hypothetical protein
VIHIYRKSLLLCTSWELWTYWCTICSFFGWIMYKEWTERSLQIERFSATLFSVRFSVGRVLMIASPSERSPKFPWCSKLEALMVSCYQWVNCNLENYIQCIMFNDSHQFKFFVVLVWAAIYLVNILHLCFVPVTFWWLLRDYAQRL